MRVIVGIVTYNSADVWEACWDALQSQIVGAQHAAPVSHRLHIDIRLYDNASTDNTLDLFRSTAPDVPLIASPINRGYGAAHNALIASAHLEADDFYLALNPDAVLHEGYIARLVEVLQNDPQAGWATGVLYQPNGTLYSLGHALRRDGYAVNIGYGLADTVKGIVPIEIFGASGAAVLIKGALLRDLRTAFDETFFVYGEDVDFDWRARRHGWRCWCLPTATAMHAGSQANTEGQVRAVVNRWLMIVKNASTWDLLLYHPPRWVVHVLLRLIITPRWGVWMLRRFIALVPQAWQVRRTDPPTWTNELLARWFSQAETEMTHQPQTTRERWLAFRYGSKKERI
jgi:GT2 family glycosyltransferase